VSEQEDIAPAPEPDWRSVATIAERVFRYYLEPEASSPRLKVTSRQGLRALEAADIVGVVLALVHVGFYSRDPEGLARMLAGRRMVIEGRQRRASQAGAAKRGKAKDPQLVARRYAELKAAGLPGKVIEPMIFEEFGIGLRRALDLHKLFCADP
jgi:hypothetical protein